MDCDAGGLWASETLATGHWCRIVLYARGLQMVDTVIATRESRALARHWNGTYEYLQCTPRESILRRHENTFRG